jgi:hypothetical protein
MEEFLVEVIPQGDAQALGRADNPPERIDA